MVWVLGILVVWILVTVMFLRGSDFSRYDSPPGQSFDAGHEPSDEHDAVVASLDVGAGPIQRAPRRQRLGLMRQYMDSISDSQDFHAEFVPVDAGGVDAEPQCRSGQAGKPFPPCHCGGEPSKSSSVSSCSSSSISSSPPSS